MRSRSSFKANVLRVCNGQALPAQVRPLKHKPRQGLHAQRLMGAPVVVELEPVANHTHRALLCFEAMPMQALLLQRANDTLHHAVVLRAVECDECLPQAMPGPKPQSLVKDVEQLGSPSPVEEQPEAGHELTLLVDQDSASCPAIAPTIVSRGWMTSGRLVTLAPAPMPRGPEITEMI